MRAASPAAPTEHGIDEGDLEALRAILRDPYGLPRVAGPTASEAGEDPAR